MRPLDTSAPAEAFQKELLQEMSLGEKLARVSALCVLNHSLFLGSIIGKKPDVTRPELLWHLAARMHGEETALKYYGPRPT